MATYYFNDRTERIESTRPSNSYTAVITEKSFKDFVEDYEQAREQHNSVIDSLEIARS